MRWEIKVDHINVNAGDSDFIRVYDRDVKIQPVKESFALYKF